MAMFQRKHYKAIAEVLALHRIKVKWLPVLEIKGAQYGHNDVLLALWEHVADLFERDNPSFDREHFLAVVRGERSAESHPSREGGPNRV
jgi:hypothetical protein